MASSPKKTNLKVVFKVAGSKKRTSIGHSNASRPKNKSERRSHKKYRGQG